MGGSELWASFALDLPLLLPLIGYLAGRLAVNKACGYLFYGAALLGFWGVAGGLYFDFLSFEFLLGPPGRGNHFMWNSGIELLGFHPVFLSVNPTYADFWSLPNCSALLLLGMIYPAILGIGFQAGLNRRRSGPLFYNTWNQNITCSFQTEDGSQWFAVFGKHSRHFPIYGASYDTVMLYNTTFDLGYSVTKDALETLRISWKKSQLSLLFEGGLQRFHERVDPLIPIEISLVFETLPLNKDRLFLKRLLPWGARWIPGAIFENQILIDANAGNLSLKCGKALLKIVPGTLRGHFENGCSSLINARAWLIPYRYLGILKDHGKGFQFYFHWRIHSLEAASFLEKLVNQIKKRINKEKLAAFNGNGVKEKSGVSLASDRPVQIREIWRDTHKMGEFEFYRSFVEAQGGDGSLGYGILEDFEHPNFHDQ